MHYALSLSRFLISCVFSDCDYQNSHPSTQTQNVSSRAKPRLSQCQPKLYYVAFATIKILLQTAPSSTFMCKHRLPHLACKSGDPESSIKAFPRLSGAWSRSPRHFGHCAKTQVDLRDIRDL